MKYPAELLEKLTFHATALDWGNVADTLGELADFVGAELCRHDVQAIGLENLDGPVGWSGRTCFRASAPR